MFLLPPVIAYIIWRFRVPRTVTSLRLFDGKVPSPWQRSNLSFWLLAAAATLAAATFHSPTWTYATSIPAENVPNLAIAIDLSGSMNAVDWPQDLPLPDNPNTAHLPPSRLINAKQHISDLLHRLPQARVALLAFAHNTVLVSPLSRKHDLLLQRLQHISPECFEDGTAIGNGLQAAVQALKHAPAGPKAIILLSDGVDHSENVRGGHSIPPEKAMELAQSQGIVVHTVAIGGKNALHPVATDQGIRWENVGEPLDEQQLIRIARHTGGSMHDAADHQQLAEAIGNIQRTIIRQVACHRVQRTLSLSPILLMTAIILSIAAMACNPPHETDHP